MEEHRHTPRHFIVVQRECSLAVMSFKLLDWKDHTARIVDISRNGIGLELRNPIDPGFVLFRDRVGGHSRGIVLWSRREQELYRAGIRLLALPEAEQHYLKGVSPMTGRHTARRSPEEIMSTLIHLMTQPDH